MKKFFIISVLVAISFANFSFANVAVQQNVPITQDDIWAYRIIQRNASVNNLADPDSIFPGQQLYYYLPDGTDTTVRVVKDDSQTNLVKGIIRDKNLTELWSRSTPSNDGYHEIVEEDLNPQEGNLNSIPNMPWWYLLILFVIMLVTFLLYNYNKNKVTNPVTAGHPQVPGGVNDEGAARRLNEIARNRFPESHQRPKNIRRVNLTGRMRVYYGQAPAWWRLFNGNKPYSKVMNIRNTTAYAGEITMNGQEQTIYFLQGCGNDAVQGNYMEVIESDVVRLNDNGSPVVAPVSGDDNVAENTNLITEEKAKEEPKTEKKQNEVLVDSELLKLASEHEALADKFLGSTNAFRATLKVNLPSGASIETVLEAMKGSQPNDPKKEEKK